MSKLPQPWGRAGVLVALVVAGCTAAKPTARPHDRGGTPDSRVRQPPARIELSAVEVRLGTPRQPLRATRWRYTLGAARGIAWIATADPGRVDLDVEPVAEPSPLGQIVAGMRLPRCYVAVDGGFYDDRGPLGLVVASGRLIHRLTDRGGSGVFSVVGGAPRIVHRSDYAGPSPGERTALQSVDRLVADGRNLVRPRAQLPRDARVVVAIDGTGWVRLAVFFDRRAVASASEGRITLNRHATTTGPTLSELAEWLARSPGEGGLGARYALNLDGGFSAAMELCFGERCASVVGVAGTIGAMVAHVDP